MSKKMSIIIPVYNVEKWLNKCVESVLQQTYENLEIILINDGSADNSGTICDYYGSKDSRVTVIHNQNSGLSVTRNIGMKQATGDYIMFLDSDDYILDNNIISNFVEILNKDKSDFIYSSYCRFNDEDEDVITEVLPLNISQSDLNQLNGIEALALLIKENSYHHAAYLKICRSDFLINNKLFFKENIYHEDSEWTPRLFYFAHKVSLYKGNYYMRRMREDSIMTTKNEKNITKKICDTLMIANELSKFYLQLNQSGEREIIINDFVRMYWGHLTHVMQIQNKKNLRECSLILDKTKEIFLYSSNKKYRMIKFFIDFLGSFNFIRVMKKFI
ncbi:glycosyltransferase [Turicibacter bilis]|uniref:glycosyltransferase n=1 Tax=Turicibacter bilis TaxID=2735723 RepID=UPI0031BAAECD